MSCKECEQDLMVWIDKYQQIVRELEILKEEEFDGWFGDPLLSHEQIIKRIRDLKVESN